MTLQKTQKEKSTLLNTLFFGKPKKYIPLSELKGGKIQSQKNVLKEQAKIEGDF